MTVKKTVANRRGGVSLPKKHKPVPKRPNPTPDIPLQKFGQISDMFIDVKQILEDYVASLRPLDRKRLNGVGIKKQGFIHRAYDYAVESPEFLPQYLPIEKFKRDEDYFNNCRVLYENCKQILEILWNLTLQSADIVYTDALEYYASVREAAKRRVDGAETIYRDLEVFFKKKRNDTDAPTKKRVKRDINSLLNSTGEGRIIVEHINPKVSGGKHKVLDEKFKSSERIKETKEGEIE
jgi:hypothetical protein